MTDRLVTVNPEMGLFVIPTADGRGYSCLGFENCERESAALADEMSIPRTGATPGTLEAYAEHMSLASEAGRRNVQTGWRSTSGLTPQLIGLEGKRVEVVDRYGETRRFYVGKSTGWIPIHLEIARRDSSGGGGVGGAPFRSVRVIPGKVR